VVRSCQRREFSLGLALEGKIQQQRLIVFSMTQQGFRFAGVVIAVVKEKDDFAADFGFEASRGLDFRIQKAFGEEPARLLAETDDGR
jgi:hypothetical protein